MKHLFSLVILFIGITACAQYKPQVNIESVTKIEDFKNFYQSGDFIFGGQPTIEALQWLKAQGITTIINLRSEKEMDFVADNAFAENQQVEQMGMNYINLPMDGKSYKPETVEEFSEILKSVKGKVFIHCGSCYRVTYLFMAYLLKEESYTAEQVFTFGKQMKFNTHLEGLLGQEMVYGIE